MKKEIIKGIIISISFSITTLITILTYASWINLSNVTTSDTLTATGWNNMISNINDLNNRVNNQPNIPTGAVIAFNGTTCPDGWNAADGSGDEKNTSGINTNLDLRGTFIRGLNGNINSRDILRNLGSYQEDSFQGHAVLSENSMHYGGRGGTIIQSLNSGNQKYGNEYSFPVQHPDNASFGIPRMSNETRPRNVALLYCVKN